MKKKSLGGLERKMMEQGTEESHAWRAKKRSG